MSSASGSERAPLRRNAAELTDGQLNARLYQRPSENIADLLMRLQKTHAELEQENRNLLSYIDALQLDYEEAQARAPTQSHFN